MKRFLPSMLLALALGGLLLADLPAAAQQKSLSSSINVYVFPTVGQDAAQQSQDEAECYNWAVQQTGADPFDLQKQAQQVEQQAQQAQAEVDQAGQGAGARGAVRGAAAGALIGEIANDDPGKGAAWGAAGGAIAGRRARKRGQQQASSQVDQQTQQAQGNIEAQTANFKKAFAACLEAKEYMVKF